MNDVIYLALVRAVHVVGVVIWIGGVAMVTMVIIPYVKNTSIQNNPIELFEQIENRFAKIARWTTLLTGISGFTLVTLLHAWPRYADLHYWWMHAMTFVWLIFTLILFIVEPFVIKEFFFRKIMAHSALSMKLIQRAHWFLLILSLLTILGAVAGSHGW